MKKLILGLAILLLPATATAALNTNTSNASNFNSIGGISTDSNSSLNNSGNSSSNSGVRNSGNSRNHNLNAQGQLQGQVSTNLIRQDQNSLSSAVNKGNTSSINIAGDKYIERRNAVNTAYAPMLTSGNDTCMGSVSAGGQATTFGLSLGKTYVDKDCVIRKDARLLNNLGYKHVAIHLLCQKPEILEAMGSAHETECSSMQKKKVAITTVRPRCDYPNQVNCNR